MTGIAVLTIGDELLSGEVADSNFPRIARAAAALGIPVLRHLSVPDDLEEISEAVSGLCESASAVVITGGLGPTADDLTTEAVAAAAGRELVFHKHLAENIERFFARLGRPMAEENLKQALLPSGAAEIPPAGGTAPGFMLMHQGVLVAALPGVPREMEAMLESHVLPEISRLIAGGSVTVTRRILTFGVGESDIAGMVSDLVDAGEVRYGFLALGGPIVLKLTAAAPRREEAEGLLDREEAMVRERLGDLVYGTGDETLEEVVGRMLAGSGRTISVAESVTGGLVCARLTEVPGSSRYLRGGVVTYCRQAKEEVAGVPGGLLVQGAVSTGVAGAMAQGVRSLFHTDIGVGITGIAGPGTGGEAKPVGTVCIGLADGEGVEAWEVVLPGDRRMIRNIAAMAALHAVRMGGRSRGPRKA